MSLRRRVTGALAWAGLVIVIAVPAAETVSSHLLSGVKPAAAATVEAPKPQAVAVVAPAVTAPASPAVKAAPAAAIATETPAASAPPVSQNPVKDYLATNKALPSYITPASSKPVAAATQTPPPSELTPAAQRLANRFDSAPPPAMASGASTSEAAAGPQSVPLPLPAPTHAKPAVERTVTEADLKDWKSGTLEDYLRAHGLLSGGN